MNDTQITFLKKVEQELSRKKLHDFYMFIRNKTHLFYDFSNYLIIPRWYLSDKENFSGSRKEINTEQKVIDINGNVKKIFPVVVAAMNFYREEFVYSADEIADKEKILFVPFYPRVNVKDEEIIKVASQVKNTQIVPTFGVNINELTLNKLLETGNILFVSIDVAHALSQKSVIALERLAKYLKNGIVWGTFGSIEAVFLALTWKEYLGINNIYLRLGIGSGSACTTRLTTGVGFPNFALINIVNFFAGRKTILEETSELLELKEHFSTLSKLFLGKDNIEDLFEDVYFILDGGFKTVGDLAKGLSFADLVMSGRLFISQEMIGNEYFGMASKYSSPNKTEYVEGDKYTVKEKRPLREVIKSMQHGLQSAFSYVNAMNVDEFRLNSDIVINLTVEGFRGAIK